MELYFLPGPARRWGRHDDAGGKTRDASRDRQARLISYVALSGLAAPVLGPPVGGAITTYLGWRWIFFLNLPLGLIGIWYALALISDDRALSVPRFDLSGFLLCGSACVSLTYGLELLDRAPTPWAAMTACVSELDCCWAHSRSVTSAAPNSR